MRRSPTSCARQRSKFVNVYRQFGEMGTMPDLRGKTMGSEKGMDIDGERCSEHDYVEHCGILMSCQRIHLMLTRGLRMPAEALPPFAWGENTFRAPPGR